MRILSVTEFLIGINEVLSGVPALVEGEVSGFSVRQEKWIFFSLKDAESVVECFMPFWKLHHAIEDGMLVRIAGVSRVYEKTGRFRMTVERLEPAGEGSLRRAFELLKTKLTAEGLFVTERKRALPRFPEIIGLITSRDAAAYTDFLRILNNRWGNVTVFVQDVRVQGEGAVEDICAAFARWNHSLPLSKTGGEEKNVRHPARQFPDVLVLTRGGGSLEDLSAFSSEAVARAIFASPIPVVVGVGHERDVTIADLVADVRASTPSNAAERVVPDRRAIATTVDGMIDGATASMVHTMDTGHALLARFLAHGAGFVSQRRARVAECMRVMIARERVFHESFRRTTGTAVAQLKERMRSVQRRSSDRVTTLERVLQNLNPSRLLARGYSLTFLRGHVVATVANLHSGDVLTTRLADGSATSTVADVLPS